MILTGWVRAAPADVLPCARALDAPLFTAARLDTLGTAPVSVQFAVLPGHAYLVEVAEHDNDALVEVVGSQGQALALADHPERRSGTRRAMLTAPAPGTLTVRITGKEHANAVGTASVRVFDLAVLRERPDCLGILRNLAAADADYATAVALGGGAVASQGAPHTDRSAVLSRAAEGYASAERALTEPGDRQLRGETALALAGIEYVDLQRWQAAADWASAAAQTLAGLDPYRRARADALLAAAWLQIGRSADPGQRLPGYGVHGAQLLARARNRMEQLSRFHLQRGERYDAGLQLTNIGLTYYFEGRYPQCVTVSRSSIRLFAAIREAQRRAQASQNEALCMWGLGRLPEALRVFHRELADVGPQPFPALYIGVINNTALLDYALGNFDESLELFNRALGFAASTQQQFGEAQSLHGIGLDYYALGGRERARAFLEHALEIRTVAFDGRGRMNTLRALATIDAEQGHLDQAIAFDREALGLAVDPFSTERIEIQLAAHSAAAGDLAQGKAQLDQVLARGAADDPLIQAEARLQRARVLRRMGRTHEALADLAAAVSGFRRVGGVTDEFAANLELARTLRSDGQPRAALTAVERALAVSDAVRVQSANPELRSQLETPLRAAYDLRIELLRASYQDALAAGNAARANMLATAAFVTADASRARSFADVAAQQYSPALRAALSADLRRREALYQQLAARRFALEPMLEHSGANDPRVRHLLREMADLERQADRLNTLIATRTQPRAMSAASGRQRLRLPQLPAGTALISYWLGAESAYAWVVNAGAIQWARLSPPQEITEPATAFHDSLTRLSEVGPEQRLTDAYALYQLIIRPLEPALAGIHQWVVIPDGALDYVPFAALRSAEGPAGSFVIAQHDVALVPAAWMLKSASQAQPRRSGRLLLVADPVYQQQDPRLSGLPHVEAAAAGGPPFETRRDYQRLLFTGREAAQIAAQFPPADVDELTGLDATRARLLALDWSRYRFIHIATHGTVDAQVPQLSALQLGSYDAQGRLVDGAVRVADLSLETLTADVAVFSACDTALGQQVPSEGLVGIASTVLARGAHAVVASLWPVSDEIGARLMTELYQHLLDSMSAPAALGEAMRSELRQHQSADPALWAAFEVSEVVLGPDLPTRGSRQRELR